MRCVERVVVLGSDMEGSCERGLGLRRIVQRAPVEQVAVEWAIHEPPSRLKVPQRHAYPYTSFDALLRLPLLRLMHTRTGCLSVDRQQQFSKYKSATTTIRRSVHQSRKTFSSEK